MALHVMSFRRGEMDIDILNFIEWKQALMRILNKGIFIKREWEDFIEQAEKVGYVSMAEDMRKRKEYYENRES